MTSETQSMERQAALLAHGRYIEYMMQAHVSAQRALLGAGAAPAIEVAAREAVNQEGQYTAYLVTALQSLSDAVFALINEVGNDRRCASAAIVAIAKQKFCDHEKFQRDFIEAAEALHGGPEHVPQQTREISMIILDHGPGKES